MPNCSRSPNSPFISVSHLDFSTHPPIHSSPFLSSSNIQRHHQYPTHKVVCKYGLSNEYVASRGKSNKGRTWCIESGRSDIFTCEVEDVSGTSDILVSDKCVVLRACQYKKKYNNHYLHLYVFTIMTRLQIQRPTHGWYGHWTVRRARYKVIARVPLYQILSDRYKIWPLKNLDFIVFITKRVDTFSSKCIYYAS